MRITNMSMAMLVLLFTAPVWSAYSTVGVYDPHDAPHNNDVDQNATFSSATGGAGSDNLLDLGAMQSIIADAFNQNAGGVVDFESGSMEGQTVAATYGTAKTKTFRFTNTTGSMTVGTGTNPAPDSRKPISGQYRAAKSTTSNWVFSFDGITGAAPDEKILIFGATLIERDSAATVPMVTATFSDGSTVTATADMLGDSVSPNNKDTFFGFVAPPGQSITSVNFQVNQYVHMDDVAFVTTIAQVKINRTPVVDAGPDMQTVALPVKTLALQGTVSDDDPNQTGGQIGIDYGKILWKQTSGPEGVTFADASKPATTATFPGKGIYTLTLEATDDGGKTGSDSILVRVKDPAVEDVLMVHYPFEEVAGPTSVDIANVNDPGTWASTVDGQLPAPGDGWVGANALSFAGTSYVTLRDKTPGDPNFSTIQYAITVAAWVKAGATSNDYATITAKGSGSGPWRLMRYSNTNRAAFHLVGPTGQTSVNGNINILDGLWHHVAGTYDGQTASLYVDGRLDTQVPAASTSFNLNADPVWIGSRADNAAGRGWNGSIDDLRIYSYAVTQAEVEQMVLTGRNVIPVVDIAPLADLLLAIDNTTPVSATASDLNGAGTLSYAWSASSPNIQFSNPAVEDPIVTVLNNAIGTFTLTLTVNDGFAQVSDTVQLTTFNPSCQQIISVHGLRLPMDLDGNCVVNLGDFAELAANWLRCYDLQGINCSNPENPFDWPQP